MHCSFQWPMSLLCRSCWCRRCFCGRQRPCDHTATGSSLFNSLVPQIQFTARVVDILLYNRDWYTAFIRGVMVAVIGLFDAFCVIFRAPPVVPELSASFSSFRALTPVSARGLTRRTTPYGDRRRQGPRRPLTSRRARRWPGERSSLALKKSSSA